MTEILTESFCERCGTRYTFESAGPRRSRLGRVRVLSKGLRNFVLSDETSLSEAMADARSEEELAATANQLDAFHQAFNFCLTCRQYTCGSCWNGAEGRCLTCAPAPELEAAAAPDGEPATVGPGAEAALADTARDGRSAEFEAWPEADLAPARLARMFGDAEPDRANAEAAVAAPAVPSPEIPPAEAAVQVPPAREVPAESEAAPAPVGGPAPGASAAGPVPAERFDVEEPADMAAAGLGAPTFDEAPPAGDRASALPSPAPTASPEDVEGRSPSLGGLAAGQSLEDAIAAWEAADDVEPGIRGPVAAERRADEAEGRADQEAPESGVDAAPREPAADQAEPVAVEPPFEGSPEAGPEAHSAPEAPETPFAPEAPSAPEAHSAPEAPETPSARETPSAPEAPEPVPAAARAAPDGPPVPAEDLVVQPAWPVPAVPVTPVRSVTPAAPVAPPSRPQPPVAPAAGPEASPWLSVAPDERGRTDPEWPAAPAWHVTTARPAGPATLAGRPLLPRDDAAALWAASAREVLSGPQPRNRPALPASAAAAAPQPCVSCGLSLSANARFCRRCGARQG